MSAFLGIDAGASSTRWLLVDDTGETMAQGRAEPLTGHVFDETARRGAERIIEAMLVAVRGCASPFAIVAGVTGLNADDSNALFLRDVIASHCRLPSTAVEVTGDMMIAYRSAFALGEGILVYAGTGSIACHVDKSGAMQRAGGHGFLIDDAGGAFWIAREALRVVLRHRDAGRAPTRLALLLTARTGGDSWPTMRSHVYGGGRAAIAALAPAVSEAAERGDREAGAILDRAGAELARLAAVMLARLGAKPIAIAGGAATAHVVAACRDALPPGAVLRHHAGEPVIMAARLARQKAGAGAAT